MKQRPRIYYSDTQKEFMWDRWQKGDSMRTIAGTTQDQNSKMAPLDMGSQPAGASFPGLGGVLPGSPVLACDPDALHRMDSIDQTAAIYVGKTL